MKSIKNINKNKNKTKKKYLGGTLEKKIKEQLIHILTENKKMNTYEIEPQEYDDSEQKKINKLINEYKTEKLTVSKKILNEDLREKTDINFKRINPYNYSIFHVLYLLNYINYDDYRLYMIAQCEYETLNINEVSKIFIILTKHNYNFNYIDEYEKFNNYIKLKMSKINNCAAILSIFGSIDCFFFVIVHKNENNTYTIIIDNMFIDYNDFFNTLHEQFNSVSFKYGLLHNSINQMDKSDIIFRLNKYDSYFLNENKSIMNEPIESVHSLNLSV